MPLHPMVERQVSAELALPPNGGAVNSAELALPPNGGALNSAEFAPHTLVCATIPRICHAKFTLRDGNG